MLTAIGAKLDKSVDCAAESELPMGGACGGYAPQRSAAGDHVSAAIERGFGKLMRVASVIDVSSCLHI